MNFSEFQQEVRQILTVDLPSWESIAEEGASIAGDIKIGRTSFMGALKERGTLVHPYLEDGFGALFCDCATVAGWAFLERHIVEKLLAAFETMFGSGKPDEACVRGRKPVFATDVFELSHSTAAKFRGMFTAPRSRQILNGRRILIASTDVHEHRETLGNYLNPIDKSENLALVKESTTRQSAENPVKGLSLSSHSLGAMPFAI